MTWWRSDNGTIVYRRNQVHFAPTQYAEVSLYDLARGLDVQIYPMKPYQHIREEHIRRVRRVYSDEAWCNSHNHHCDPELFDNFIRGNVAIDNATSALAFRVAFERIRSTGATSSAGGSRASGR